MSLGGILGENFTGIAVNYTKARNLAENIPLFWEWGVGGQISFASSRCDKDEESYRFISVKIPVNLIYDVQIQGTNINIDPYIGLKVRTNIWGTVTDKIYSYSNESYTSYSENLFGSDGWNAKRIQLGWNIGVKARFNEKYFIGIAYGSDFNDFTPGVKIKETSISAGLVF